MNPLCVSTSGGAYLIGSLVLSKTITALRISMFLMQQSRRFASSYASKVRPPMYMRSASEDRLATHAIRLTGLLLFACLVSGCMAPPPTPGPKWLYYEEPIVSREPVAFLFGRGQPGEVLVPVRAFVFAVDDKRVESGKDRWNVPIPLRPGSRVVSVEINRGSAYARVNLSLNADAGKDYGIRFATDLGGANSFCDFWIIDAATGAPVTKVQRGYVIR